ncbi:MAG: hypothetical protein ABI175_04685, partial [Polyangiales bacterium]
ARGVAPVRDLLEGCMVPFTPRALLGIALGAWCVCVAIGLAAGAPLTSDEASYGLLARGLDQGWIYRPIGLVAVAKLGVALGSSDAALRLPCALASPLLLLAIDALGRRLGPWCGAGAAAVVAGTHTFALRAPEMLSDLPSATCLIAALVVIVDELEREGGPRYRLIAAAPLLAGAFYLRYGTAPVIALIGGAAIVAWPRAVRARPGPVIATVLVLGALVAPFAIYSWQTTGSALGILEIAGEVSGRKFLGQGLRAYIFTNPFRRYGVLITPAMFAGFAAIALPPRDGRSIARFLAMVAIGQVLILGIVAHASTRYVFLAMAVLCMLGVELVVRGSARIRTAAVIGAVLGCAVMVTTMLPLERAIARGLTRLVASANAVRADAAGRPCVLVVRAVPQAMWYAGCEAVKIAGPDEAVVLAPGWTYYAVDTPRRPVDAPAIAARSQAKAIALAVPGAWRLVPRGP